MNVDVCFHPNSFLFWYSMTAHTQSYQQPTLCPTIIPCLSCFQVTSQKVIPAPQRALKPRKQQASAAHVMGRLAMLQFHFFHCLTLALYLHSLYRLTIKGLLPIHTMASHHIYYLTVGCKSPLIKEHWSPPLHFHCTPQLSKPLGMVCICQCHDVLLSVDDCMLLLIPTLV